MKLVLPAALVLALPVAALAQIPKPAPHTETIVSPSLSFMPPHDLVDRVMTEDPAVQRAGALLKSAQAEARGREAGPHEFIAHGEYYSRATNIDGRLDEWTVGVSRGIRLPGKADADSKIGQYTIAVAENGFGDARHQTATLLKNLWLAWVMAEAESRLAVEEVTSYERQLKAVERGRQLGQAASLQVEQVQAALAQARAQVALAAQGVEDARMTLVRTFPNLALPAAPPAMPEPAPPPGEWKEWRSAVLDDNHEIKMARSEADRRQWLATRASLDRYADPTLDLRTFQERSGHETGFGVGFTMPIGGALRSAAADQAAAEATAASVVAHKALRDVEIVADRDVIQARQGIAAWQQSQIAAASSRQMTARMQRAYELGDQGLTELLIAQRQDFEVRRAEMRARGAAHGAVLQLMIDAHRIWSLGDE
ncbi:MAG: TolC family protein [Alphaproteobacteria bacterium]